jgi:hypothetical protein
MSISTNMQGFPLLAPRQGPYNHTLIREWLTFKLLSKSNVENLLARKWFSGPSLLDIQR